VSLKASITIIELASYKDLLLFLKNPQKTTRQARHESAPSTMFRVSKAAAVPEELSSVNASHVIEFVEIL
jgi:hypothetical protein